MVLAKSYIYITIPVYALSHFRPIHIEYPRNHAYHQNYESDIYNKRPANTAISPPIAPPLTTRDDAAPVDRTGPPVTVILGDGVMVWTSPPVGGVAGVVLVLVFAARRRKASRVLGPSLLKMGVRLAKAQRLVG